MPTRPPTHKPCPAEAFPPSDYIREEMDARGWTEEDVSARCALGVERVKAILGGDRISLWECAVLGQAFDTTPAFWANLQLYWKRYADPTPDPQTPSPPPP
jgi:HTH-type transcriptional regulator / antitoxin HigA